MDCSRCYMCQKAPCHFNYNNDKDISIDNKDEGIFNNTIDQAEYLNSKETDFNILLILCYN